MKSLKSFLAVLAALGLAAILHLLAEPTQKQLDYINRWSATAQKEMKRSGVPASITLAQGLLESGNGQSELTVAANNHFGIKAMPSYHGPVYKIRTKEYVGGKWITVDAKFRKYSSGEKSFADHSDYLRYSARYQSLFELDPTDYKGWAKGLSQAGYATDPEYADKLIRLIEDCDLARFDTKKSTPRHENKGETIIEEAIETPVTPLTLEKEEEVTFKVNSSENYSYNISRKVYKVNSTLFVKAHEGESYESIAKVFNLFHSEILSYNDLKNDRQLHEGDRVFIQAKRAKAVKGLDKHVISDKCESLWSISQEYGIRLKKLYKINHLESTYVPVEGDVIILRK